MAAQQKTEQGMAVQARFKLRVMNPDRMIFDGEAESLFVQGNTGEFELMSYHYPILSLLKSGEVIIDWKYFVPVKQGIVKFFRNDCTVVVEVRR